jgi:hippurate hydrolase
VAETVVSEAALTALIEAALPSLIAVRHELHANPQLGFQETYAAAVVQRELAADGIPFQAEVAGTGVVAWLRPADDSGAPDAICLRAELDALPILEQTALPYASHHPGLMHACGHDGHMAILIGAARVLSQMRGALPQGVKFLFQPAEEDGAGAARLIEAGALDEGLGGLAARRAFGLHGWPSLPLGTIGVRAGTIMAARDSLHIIVHGRGGHGAIPHLTADPVLAAAHLVVALQSIISRSVDATLPAVITVGSLRAGHASNVIPDRAELRGTIRALDGDVMALLRRRIREVSEGIAQAMGCRAEVLLEPGYPATINDQAEVARVRRAAADALGRDRVVEIDRPSMAAEDFSFYGQRLPTCFFFLGLRPARTTLAAGLHTPVFDFNDDAIRTGVQMFCRLALSPVV